MPVLIMEIEKLPSIFEIVPTTIDESVAEYSTTVTISTGKVDISSTILPVKHPGPLMLMFTLPEVFFPNRIGPVTKTIITR